MGVIKNRGTKRGPGLAGALAVVVLATASGGRAGAGEASPRTRRVVPDVFGRRLTAPRDSGAVPALVLEGLVALAGRTLPTLPNGLPLGHFLSPQTQRAVRLSSVVVDSETPSTATRREAPCPTFPGMPGLVLATPLLVPGRGGAVRGELRTALSEVWDSAGAMIGVLGRTLFTSPNIVESQPFLMDAKGSTFPLAIAKYREALRQHDTVLIGDDRSEFNSLVETMHFPAGEIPVDRRFAREATPTTWWDDEVRWGALTMTRRTVDAKNGDKVRIVGPDGGEIVIPLGQGAVELRTRLFRMPETDAEAPLQVATLPTEMDWRFVLERHSDAGALLIPLPTSGFGGATGTSVGYSTRGPGDDEGRPRDWTASGRASLRLDQVRVLLTGTRR